MANAFHFSPSTHILRNLLSYQYTNFPLYFQQQKRDLKHYEHVVSRHLFPAHLSSRQGPPEFITEDKSTEPFHIFMTLLIVLPSPSLHIEMVTYLRRTPTIERAELHILSILVLKCTAEMINLLSKGTRVRWSAELF